MTTQDVRQQVKDRINGTAVDDDKYDIIPMTFNEAARAAEGLIEEFGLVGSLSVRVEYWNYAHGGRDLKWVASLVVGDDVTQYYASTAERMVDGFRLELLKLVPNQPIDLGAVGIPSIPSEQGA